MRTRSTNENAIIQAERKGGQVRRGILLRSRQREGPDASLCVQRVLYGDEVGEYSLYRAAAVALLVLLKLSNCRRSKFVGDCSIHCYEVQWEPSKLSWESFRGELLGPTDPKEGKFCTINLLVERRHDKFMVNNASVF